MGLADRLRAGDLAGFHDERLDEERPDLFAEELDGLDLEGVDLTGAVLDKSDLTGTVLRRSKLIRASLVEVDAVGLDLSGAVAFGARLREAQLVDVLLVDTDLSHADLTQADISGAQGAGVRLASAKLKDAVAKGASLPGADLSSAGLKNTDLTGADLTGAKLGEAQGGSTVLTGARLDGCDAHDAKLSSSKAAGASFVGAILTGVHLGGADLTGADFTDADLTRANLAGAVLTGARLVRTKLVDACLDGVDLSTCVLDGADLTGLDVASLGLDAARAATLAAHGAAATSAGPRLVRDPSVACLDGATAVVWRNPEGEGKDSIRWAVVRASGTDEGVLPPGGSTVFSHAVVAAGGMFRVVLVVLRSDGPVLMSWPLDASGLGAGTVVPLGFDPAVVPVITGADDGVRLYGLGRRGPTLVGLRDALDGAGFKPAFGSTQPQARGFAARSSTVLVGKGGVVWPITPKGIGAPVRVPEGFAETPGTVVLAGTDDTPLGGTGIVAVWTRPAAGRRPGAVLVGPLGTRKPVEPDDLDVGTVMAVDAIGQGEQLWIAWVEAFKGGATRARLAGWPRGFRAVDVEAGDTVVGARWVRDAKGVRLVVTTAEGRVQLVGTDGKVSLLLD